MHHRCKKPILKHGNGHVWKMEDILNSRQTGGYVIIIIKKEQLLQDKFHWLSEIKESSKKKKNNIKKFGIVSVKEMWQVKKTTHINYQRMWGTSPLPLSWGSLMLHSAFSCICAILQEDTSQTQTVSPIHWLVVSIFWPRKESVPCYSGNPKG